MNNLQAIYFTDFKNSYIPHILKEIYLDRIYEPFLHGKKDLTMVDLGANIGLASYYFKDFAKVVYAVEPAKSHVRVMSKMLKNNKVDNVVVCSYAIAPISGTAKFYHNTNTTMYSLTDRVNGNKDYEEVKTLDFVDFFKVNNLEKIDFLKLDVEGTEGELMTSDAFITVADKINTIMGEWHAWGSMSQSQFQHCLEDMGYNFKWLNNTEASVFVATRT